MEVEYALRSLKKGQSTCIDYIPCKININGGSQMIITMTLLCLKIWSKKS